jgi:hypothetical protein
MAMTVAHQNAISVAGKLAKAMLMLEGEINQLDVLVNGVTQYGNAITDADILAIPIFAGAGLTKQQFLDTVYVLKMARDAFMANLPSVTVLAHLP